VIVAGLVNFNASLLTFPPDAFQVNTKFVTGLGAAMLIAIYDYLGYYNICHLGDEVSRPEKTIPRAVMGSVVVVALIYLTMNISIIGVVPWQKAMLSKNIAADFMEMLYGRTWAVIFTAMIIWTAMACMLAITVGYSRIPYAAAKGGDFFAVFGILHPTGRYPVASLLTLGVLTSAFCFLSLADIINAAVCVRIVVQFLGQIAGLHYVRKHRPEIQLPFRMWLYPIPSGIAAVGWIFVLATSQWKILLLSLAVLVSGVLVFLVRSHFETRKRN